ncbi:MAG: DUF222 domain-containing protein [Actinomycetota bacterium]|nr:DUF222 domain-containing protein [Actinomycetota bacterium]
MGRLECRSCAHWLNWKCGIDLATARQKVRVAHSLRQLPMTATAFAAGQLSYSKVRALTRVATPDNEADLLDLALTGTTSQLERIVRAYRGPCAATRSTRPTASTTGAACSGTTTTTAPWCSTLA